MKFGNEIEVETANLHQSVIIGGVQTDKTLNKTKYPGIKMTLLPQGLHICIKGEDFIIPHAAIGSCKLAKVKKEKV